MRRKRLFGLVAVGVLLIAAAGCGAVVAGAAAGAGAVAYVRGELEVTEEASISRVFEAAKGAIDDLEFKLLTADADAYEGKVRAETARGTDIGISLERQSDTVTKIRIRVGVFGDENLSRLVHEKMKARLATS
ncbi:MAG: DUF3568 family protein [Verrucomicrobia bacterium]|nr:DUF3568 family protein [Verrucomicrobiota bacterium]